MIAYFENIRGGQLGPGVKELKGCRAVQCRFGNPAVASVYAISCSDSAQGRAVLREMGVERIGDETRMGDETERLVERALANDDDALMEIREREWFD